LSEDLFKITEYVYLGLGNNYRYYPLEETRITFRENGFYNLDTRLIFEPPQFNKRTLYHIYNANNSLLKKLKNNIPLRPNEQKDLQYLPENYLICFLNNFEDAKDKLMEAQPYLKKINGDVYQSFKESSRILRKMKYS
jgi:hypothetical protein